jgi:hypothetical protein
VSVRLTPLDGMRIRYYSEELSRQVEGTILAAWGGDMYAHAVVEREDGLISDIKIYRTKLYRAAPSTGGPYRNVLP